MSKKKGFIIYRVEAKVPNMERYYESDAISFCKSKKKAQVFKTEKEMFDVLKFLRSNKYDVSFEPI